MSYFKERHPPMGSEKDLDNIQTVYNIDDTAPLSSNSSDELDELSLRVKALLSETDDDPLLDPFYQEYQEIKSVQYDEVATKAEGSYSTLNFKYSQYSDLKLCSQRDGEKICCEHSFKDLDASDEAFFDTHVGTSEISEKAAESDVLNVSEAHDNVLQPSTSCKMYEQGISEDSFYYSVNENYEKHISSSNYLQKNPPEIGSFVKDASYNTNHCTYILTPSEENEEQLSVHNISGYPVLPITVFALQPQSDKDVKEFLWSKCSDYDTPPLSASSVASSKRLEWDNAADIGYIIDATDNTNNNKKNRREPEGYSIRTETSNMSSQHATNLRNQFSVLKDSNKLEEKKQCEIFHSCSDTLGISQSKISDESKDFASKSHDKHDESGSLYGKEPPASVPRDLDNSLKQIRVQKHDFSVRPKDKIYVHASKQSGRKSAMHEKPISFETQVIYSKPEEQLPLGGDKTMQDETTKSSSEADIASPKVSFIPSTSYINIDPTQKEIPYSEQYESHTYEMLPPSVGYYNQIISTPIYIDSDILDSQNIYSKSEEDNAISNPESFPHIRWYPLPAYKNSQNIKNVSSQTSLPFHQEQMTDSPESFDNTDMGVSLCDETISLGTQTQTNENVKRDVNEATHITVDSYPHVIENLSYENVILSIQRNTNEIFPPLARHTIDCHCKDEKEDKADGCHNLTEIKLILDRALSRLMSSSMYEKASNQKPFSNSYYYVINFAAEGEMQIIKDAKCTLLSEAVCNQFRSLGKYNQDVLKKFHERRKLILVNKMKKVKSNKEFLMQNWKRKKKYSEVLRELASGGKITFDLHEILLSTIP